MSGKRVDLKSSDGVLDLHVFTPESGVGPWPAVVLYMDAFGIRPELAEHGATARLEWLRRCAAKPLLPDAVRAVRTQRRCH